MSVTPVELGRRIADTRNRASLTIEEAAELAGETAEYWSAVERGEERTSLGRVLLFASVLGVPLSRFLDDTYIFDRLQFSPCGAGAQPESSALKAVVERMVFLFELDAQMRLLDVGHHPVRS